MMPRALRAPRQARRPAAGVAFVLTSILALVACGNAEGDSPETGSAPSESAPQWPSPADIAASAADDPALTDTTLTYIDPDGHEHEDPPADPANWRAQIDLAPRAGISAGATSLKEIVADLVESRPADAEPRLEIWVRASEQPEVAALAYPTSADGADPVRDALLMGATPGVVRSVFSATTADVQVNDASDLVKVGDVADAQDVQIDAIYTARNSAVLEVADVPPRPEVTTPDAWPDDPDAPDCGPDDLRLLIAGTDAATGARWLTLEAVNIGAAPCALEGYPEIGFHTRDEDELDVTVTRDDSTMATGTGERLVLPPSSRAVAVVEWRAMQNAEDVTSEVVVAVRPGARPAELPVTSFAPALDDDSDQVDPPRPIMTTLDIIGGGEVSVTPWAQEADIRS